MPLYEHRCPSCETITTALRSMAEAADPVACAQCGRMAGRIVSRPSVRRSNASKVDRLDPMYDRMVDKAMSNTQHADPDRHLKRLKSSD